MNFSSVPLFLVNIVVLLIALFVLMCCNIIDHIRTIMQNIFIKAHDFHNGNNDAGWSLLGGIIIWLILLGPPIYIFYTFGLQYLIVTTISFKLLYIGLGIVMVILLKRFLPQNITASLMQYYQYAKSIVLFA